MRKRFFSVRRFERKSIMVDPDLHLLISKFAEDADVTMSEALYLLVGPGLAVVQGLDYSKPMGLIREQLATKM